MVDLIFLALIVAIFGAGILGWSYFFLAFLALGFLRGALGVARMFGFKMLG